MMVRGKETAKRDDFGERDPVMMIAGPCSVESEDQLDRTAAFLSQRGVRYLRGGSFKPRTQSASFQGLGRIGLEIMSRVAARYGMMAVTELMDRSQLDDVVAHADIIQVGSRNMFNYSLLTALGAVDKPILLKRGMAATIDEWLHAADYIRRGGNARVILCERGIRTFEPRTRYTLDLLAIPIAQKLSGLPVIADVSHAAGERSLVAPLVMASLAAGADGIMVEVHPEPDTALSDAAQSLSFADFDAMHERARKLGFFDQRSITSPYPFPR
jgi:3-deoxy-7-phosphoheptulonate synthase